MTNTNFLLILIAAAMLGIHWFPEVAYPVIVIALIGWVLNAFPKWRDRGRQEKTIERQLKADRPLRNEFWAKDKAIRDKYDPNHEWNEGTSLPPEYTTEMADLNAEYRAVMDRWDNQ